MSITLAVNADGIFGAGPHQFSSAPLSVHWTLSLPVNASFATSRELWLLSALPHQQCLQHRRFFSTFHFFLIGEAVGKLALYQQKVFFDFFCQNGNFWSAKILFSSLAWDSRGSHFAVLATCSPWQHCTNSLLWHANCGLNVLNPRFANLSSNRALNYAILTAC